MILSTMMELHYTVPTTYEHEEEKKTIIRTFKWKMSIFLQILFYLTILSKEKKEGNNYNYSKFIVNPN